MAEAPDRGPLRNGYGRIGSKGRTRCPVGGSGAECSVRRAACGCIAAVFALNFITNKVRIIKTLRPQCFLGDLHVLTPFVPVRMLFSS